MKKSKIKLKLLVAALIIGGFIMSFAGIFIDKNHVFAEDSFWNNQITVAPNGDGTESRPFEIQSASNLAYLSKECLGNASVFYDCYFILKNNIDLSQHYFTPIGSGQTISQLIGIDFDGGNHSITGLRIKQEEGYVGLFGYLYLSNIRNLKIENAAITADGSSAGVLAGYAANSSFENITLGGSLIGSKDNVGGCVGRLGGDENNFENITNNVNVTAESGSYTGGIFGSAESGRVSLENCANNGNISGIAYVSGIGSGSSNTTAQFILKSCTNSKKIGGTSPNQNYFAGLIAYASSYEENSIELCSNLGQIDAANSTYVAGLVGFGKFNINNSFNNGQVNGHDLVAGIAAVGRFNVSGCYNGEGGKVTAVGIDGNVISAGIIARASGESVVEKSYNKGTISVASSSGISAGIIGSYNAVNSGAQTIVVSNCYNWGAAKDAFIGRCLESKIVTIYNCYNIGTAKVEAEDNVIYSYVHNGGTAANLYENLSSQSPLVWGLQTGYNNGYPYIGSQLVSEVNIDVDGGVVVGNFISNFVQDLFAETRLTFTDFIKTGYNFVGFSTIKNDTLKQGVFIDKDSPNPVFTSTLKTHTLYVQYQLVNYTANVLVRSQFADRAELYESDKTTLAGDDFINLQTQRVLKAEKVGTNEFSYWAVDIGGELFQISNQEICELSLVFNTAFLTKFSGRTTFDFVAVFEESWEVEVEITFGDKSWAALEIINGGRTDAFNFNNSNYRVAKNKHPQTEEILPTQLNFVLSAFEFYQIFSFTITAVGEGAENTIFDGYEFNDLTMNRGVKLESNLKISIGLIKRTYYFETTSVFEDYSQTQANLVDRGASASFSIDQTVLNTTIIAKTTNIEGYRFMGFKIRYADGAAYSPYIATEEFGRLDAFVTDSDFLERYFNQTTKKIHIVAVYERQMLLTVVFESGNLEYGSLDVKINNSYLPYNGRYFDKNTNIKIQILPNDNCTITRVAVNQTVLSGSFIEVYLTENLTIYITIEKTKYYLELFTIDYHNNPITGLEYENLEISSSKEDEFGKYVEYNLEYYIINHAYLENSNNMKFMGWFYLLPNGSLIEINSDILGNLKTTITKDDINKTMWTDSGSGRNYITIVAKIIDVYTLDINLSSLNELRGDYVLQIFDTEKNEFVNVDKAEREFNIGERMRIIALANQYFDFDGFEDSRGNPLYADMGTTNILTFDLDKSQMISLYFKAMPYAISRQEDTSQARGELNFVSSSGNLDEIQIGDNIVISFYTGNNFTVRKFTINGVNLSELERMFGATLSGNSVAIEVSTAFLNWLSLNEGKIQVEVSTTMSTFLFVLLLGIMILVPGLLLFSLILTNKNSLKRQSALIVKLREDRNREGLLMHKKIESIRKDFEE